MMLGDTEYVGLTTIIVLFITLVWFMTFGLSLFPHAPETYLSYSMIGVALAGAGLRLWGQLARRFAWKIVSDVRQASPEILRDMRELVKSTESDIQLLTTEPCDHTEEDASLPTCV